MRVSLRYLSSKPGSPSPDLPVEVNSDDTVLVLRDKSRLALEAVSDYFSKDFHLVWGGHVLADYGMLLSTMLVENGSIIQVVNPPTSFLENEEDIVEWLPKIFNINIHYPIKREQHDFSTKDLFKQFCDWVDAKEAAYLWKPSNEDKWKQVKDAVDEFESTEPSFLGSRHIKFYGDCGCALLSKVVHADETVHLTLIGLDSWELQIHSGEGGRVYSSKAPPEKKICLNVGKINLSSYSKFLHRADYLKSNAVALKREGIQKTPAFIRATMVDAIYEIEQRTSLVRGQQALPIGGFTDVGLHTGNQPRDTTWALIWAVLLEMVNDSPFMEEVFLEFRVAIVECFGAHLMKLDSSASRALTDTMMQTLRETTLGTVDKVADESRNEQLGRFEARCVRLVHELRGLESTRAKKRAADFKLEKLKKADIKIRNFCLSPPQESEPPEQARSLFDIRILANSNLGGLPLPSIFHTSEKVSSKSAKAPNNVFSHDDVQCMIHWIENPKLQIDSDWQPAQKAETAFLICRLVENFFYAKIARELIPAYSTDRSTSVGEACRDIEHLINKYREAACLLQKNPTYCLLSVETRARELLTVWAGFCLIHDMTCSVHSVLRNYNPALDPRDLEHLVLADKLAIDSLRHIVIYLRFRSKNQFCVFSLREVDRTFDLAREYGRKELRNEWLVESKAMEQREEQRWKEITQRQEQLAVLDSELDNHKITLHQCKVVLSHFHKPRFGWNNATTSENNAGYRAAKEQVDDCQRRVSSVEGDIANTESAPSPIHQPLPECEERALPILFFLLMPLEFQVLSSLSFSSQQLLLPSESTLSSPTIDSVTQEQVHIRRLIKDKAPSTYWRKYYTSASTSPLHTAVDTAVLLGSEEKPPDGRWYNQNVRQCKIRRDGVFYPDILVARLLWGGGKFCLDHRPKTPLFDPFVPLPKNATVYSFTEQLPKDFQQVQWCMEQHGDQASTCRGSWPEAAQDPLTKVFADKREQLVFGTLRAYPHQQLRKLCSALKERSLSLDKKVVRMQILQSLYHVGPLTEEDPTLGTVPLWRNDLTRNGGWLVMQHELTNLAEELRHKARDHGAVQTLGLIAAHASHWDAGCHKVSRDVATISSSWADRLGDEIDKADPEDIPVLRARRCIFYMYSILSYGGDWSCEDVAQICELTVLAELCRIFEVKTSLDDEVRILSYYTVDFLSRKLDIFLSMLEPDVLTQAANTVFGHQHENLKWCRIKTSDSLLTPCFEAVTPTEHVVSINPLSGVVLHDGLPPKRLPDSILQNPLYRRSFSDRNFDVIEEDGVMKTTRDFGGRRYSFSCISKDEIRIREQEMEASLELELLDGTAGLWGSELPVRLMKMYSHWLSRKKNVIVVRPISFNERKVYYLLVHRKNTVTAQEEGWHCWRIPDHLREDHWTLLLNKTIGFDELKSFEVQNPCVLAVLQRFEPRKEMIHCILSSENQLIFEYPRYGLEFLLSEEDGRFHSKSFSGYVLHESQQLIDTLHGFEQYLVLKSLSKRTKLLVPAGKVQSGEHQRAQVCLSSQCDADLKFHIYEIHPRFATIEPPPGLRALEARLQLSVLHAVTGCSIPERRCEQTGGERAMELIRQSFVNRPMTAAEHTQLASLWTCGKINPAIPLLCSDLDKSSRELHFLHPKASEGNRTETIEFDTGAADHYKELKRKGHLIYKASMTQYEENRVLGGTVEERLESSEHATIKVNNRRDGIVSRLALHEIRKSLKQMLVTRPVKQHKPICSFEDSDLGSSRVGQEMMDELRESCRMDRSRSIQDFCSSKFAEHIRGLRWVCKTARSEIEGKVLAAVSHIPSQQSVHWLRFSLRRLATSESRVSIRDLALCSMSPKGLKRLNPSIGSEDDVDYHYGEILHWLELCVMEDKLDRMHAMEKSKDDMELQREFREIDRFWDVRKFPRWLLFEVEQRLQIRELQYKVAAFCFENPGKITQLNMALLGEAYDYLHQTLTASLLNQKLFLLPFQRDVKLTLQDAESIRQCLRRCDEERGALCLAPEHRLSLHLKWIEGETSPEIKSCLKDIDNFPYVDIFDESDEILHHKFQLIYAVGNCIQLPGGHERWVMAQTVLHQVQCNPTVKKILHMEGVSTFTTGAIRGSGSFDQTRLIPGKALDGKRAALLGALAQGVLHNPPYSMRWIQLYSSRQDVLNFVVDPSLSIEVFVSKNSLLNRVQLDQILSLRGFLAAGILEHCLSRRYRVDYGIDQRRGTNRRIAVPYRACDSPSERAEYVHPDIMIILTQLSYYYQGLARNEILEAVKLLLNRTGFTAQQKEYESWLELAQDSFSDEVLNEIDDVAKLDYTNETQLTAIHDVYQYNMVAINFWLDRCVFPRETMQFPRRLAANACHLASNNKNGQTMGFSGTKDNHLLLPLQVEQEIPNHDQLVATDGKMVRLIQQNEKVLCLRGDSTVPEQVMQLAVERRAHALLDAGASMAGLSNEEVADGIIDILSKKDSKQIHVRGVVYFDKTWIVKDLQGRKWSLGSSPIAENEALVFFDESHCRGVDMKTPPDAKALLTLSVGMCKDKLVQAAGRMRKLDCGQFVEFVVPYDVKRKIIDALHEVDITTNMILRWVMHNTMATIVSSLPEWASQQSYYSCTSQHPKGRLVDETLEVQELYGEAIGEGYISSLVDKTVARDLRRVDHVVSPVELALLQRVKAHTKKYGEDQRVVASSNNEECERELENERELQREMEREVPTQRPQQCKDWGIAHLLTAGEVEQLPPGAGITTLLKAVDLRFDSKLSLINWVSNIYVTSSFIETVASLEGRRLDDLSDFIRPVDAVVLFGRPGKSDTVSSCLLLSEWEADQFLSLLRTKRTASASFVNIAFLREAADSAWMKPIKLQAPLGYEKRGVNDDMMAGLQLFAGHTMYGTPGRKEALKRLLPNTEAKHAALELVSLRGQRNFISRSDLEEVCDLDMLGTVV